MGLTGGLANAVVWLEGSGTERPLTEPARAYLDNRACRFVPHVQAIQAGTAVAFRNSDPILHSAHAYLRRETLFHVGLPVFRKEVVRQLIKPGLVRVRCDSGHTWQEAFIYVFEHPLYAVTDPGGRFRIRGVPAGQYRLRAWHESLGMLEKPVTLDKERGLEVALTYEAPEE